MKYRLEFELPGLPKMDNPSGSRSTHWRYAHAEADKWKTLVRHAVGQNRPKQPLKWARIVGLRASSVAPDYGGLVRGFKHVLDGLIEAGVLEDDKLANIGVPDLTWTHAPAKKGYIKVLVVELKQPPFVGSWADLYQRALAGESCEPVRIKPEDPPEAYGGD